MSNFDENRFASKSIEYETPESLFNPLDKEFNFTLDVCATDNNTKVKEKYFTKETDGLKQSWKNEVCWMNPPYGREMIAWLNKAKYESDQNNAIVVCLIPARTNTKWWGNICLKSSEIRFVQGRPKFNGGKHGLPFPLAIIVFNGEENCKMSVYK